MNHILMRAVAVSVLLLGATVYISAARRPEVPVQRAAFSTFPVTFAGWRSIADQPLEKSVLNVLGVDDYVSRIYQQPGVGSVGLYAGFYGSQRQGDTIHSPLNCLPGSGWEPLSEDRISIENVDGKGRNVTVNRFIVQKGLDRQLVIYWYQSQGRVIASEYWSRAWLIHDAIRTNRSDGAIVRVVTPLQDSDAGGAAAEAVAVDFVRAIFPLLDPYLAQ